eukprot:scaffold4146_cov91-Skeletonema_marinoi.AAC.1
MSARWNVTSICRKSKLLKLCCRRLDVKLSQRFRGVPVTSTLMLLPMQSIEKEVCDELVHSLLEMGASSDVHSKLRQR